MRLPRPPKLSLHGSHAALSDLGTDSETAYESSDLESGPEDELDDADAGLSSRSPRGEGLTWSQLLADRSPLCELRRTFEACDSNRDRLDSGRLPISLSPATPATPATPQSPWHREVSQEIGGRPLSARPLSARAPGRKGSDSSAPRRGSTASSSNDRRGSTASSNGSPQASWKLGPVRASSVSVQPPAPEKRRLSCASARSSSQQRERRNSHAPFASRIANASDAFDMRLFLLDNSGSTRKMDGTLVLVDVDHARVIETDRWCETCSMALEHAEWNVRHGVRSQFVLLNPHNPHSPMEGRDFVTVDPKLPDAKEQVAALANLLKRNGPCGNTPLTSRLRQLRQRQQACGVERLALTIVTDGLPTSTDSTTSTEQDKDAFLQELQAWYTAFDCELVIRLTTDQGNALGYYHKVAEMVSFRMEVLDDVHGEARRARRRGNGWLAYSPLVHQKREACASGNALGQLAQRPLTPGEIHEVLEFLLRKPEMKPFPHDAEGLYQAAERALARAPLVYNGRLQCMTPPVDLPRLKRALGLCFSAKRLKELPGMVARAVAMLPRRRSSTEGAGSGGQCDPAKPPAGGLPFGGRRQTTV